ncbi:hypothetical protein G9P44_004455 [Scheffersomyces stipitis]|nr:hypothetical protein G9P44_004455 [Scheffersomyces stipitis]
MSWFCSITLMALVIAYVNATPPACFLSCIAEVAKTCPLQKMDITCLCAKEDSVLGCMVDICPYGTFFSGRDHFIGTCMEHGRPSISNPHPPDPIYPPKLSSSISTKPTPISSFSSTITDGSLTSENSLTSVSLSKPARSSIVSSSTTVSLSTGTTSPYWTSWTTSTISSLPTSRKTSIITSTISSIKYKPSMTWTTSTQQQIETGKPESDCDSDTESEDEYNSDEDCEWEETQSVDADGNVIFIRRPINVPQKYRNPKNNGKTRKVIIKKPPQDYQWKVGKDKVVRVVRKLKNTPAAAIPTKSKNIESNLYSHPSPTIKKSRYNRYPN